MVKRLLLKIDKTGSEGARLSKSWRKKIYTYSAVENKKLSNEIGIDLGLYNYPIR